MLCYFYCKWQKLSSREVYTEILNFMFSTFPESLSNSEMFISRVIIHILSKIQWNTIYTLESVGIAMLCNLFTFKNGLYFLKIAHTHESKYILRLLLSKHMQPVSISSKKYYIYSKLFQQSHSVSQKLIFSITRFYEKINHVIKKQVPFLTKNWVTDMWDSKMLSFALFPKFTTTNIIQLTCKSHATTIWCLILYL